MTLQILISTIDSGIEKIKDILLPARSDVTYIVSHQYQSEEFKYIPEILNREDVLVSQISGKGLSKSRNHAISIATSDICLISDDDVRYTNEYLDTIIHVFQEKKPDVALFKIKTNDGESEYKNYPEHEYQIGLDNMHWPSSIEIAFNTSTVMGTIYFDERFGLGSSLAGGEEYFFIRDSIEKGLKVHFFPFYIVNHPKESTIKSFPKYHKRMVMVRGANDARINGWLSIVRTLGISIRLTPSLVKNKKNPLVYFFQRLRGNIYILSS